MTRARARELSKLVDECGLRLVEIVQTGGSHYKVIVERNDGVRRNIICSLTPSDRRAHLNNRALLRRFAERRDDDGKNS